MRKKISQDGARFVDVICVVVVGMNAYPTVASNTDYIFDCRILINKMNMRTHKQESILFLS